MTWRHHVPQLVYPRDLFQVHSSSVYALMIALACIAADVQMHTYIVYVSAEKLQVVSNLNSLVSSLPHLSASKNKACMLWKKQIQPNLMRP